MPKVKTQSNWRSKPSEEDRGSSESKFGFQNKEKAEQTLNMLKGRDITHQFRVISGLNNRAKTILTKTKDPQKVQNIKEAIETFDKWLFEYKKNSRSKENFGYLPLDVLNAYKELADHIDVLDDSNVSGTLFHNAYLEAEGDLKKLRAMSPDDDGETWDVVRNNAIRRLTEDLPEDPSLLFHKEGPLQGLPTSLHTKLIMWAYSPDATKIKKEAANVHWKVNKDQNK